MLRHEEIVVKISGTPWTRTMQMWAPRSAVKLEVVYVLSIQCVSIPILSQI